MYKKWIRHMVERLRVERALLVWCLKINLSHRSWSQAILGMPSEPVSKLGPRFGGSATVPNRTTNPVLRLDKAQNLRTILWTSGQSLFFAPVNVLGLKIIENNFPGLYLLSFWRDSLASHHPSQSSIHTCCRTPTGTAPSRLQLLASLST